MSKDWNVGTDSEGRTVSELQRSIHRVWLRLRIQRFVTLLVWGLAIGFTLAAMFIGVEKLLAKSFGPVWLPFALAGGLALSVSVLLACFTGPDRTDAALAIDRAFDLSERVSSALGLPEHLRSSPAGEALIRDTTRHVECLDISAKFGLRLPRRAWAPLIPLAAGIGLLFAPQWIREQSAQARIVDPKEQERISKKVESLRKAISEQKKKIDKSEFGETEKLLAEIEKVTQEMEKTQMSKEKALIELNKLSDALKERQKQVGDAAQVEKQLKQLRDLAKQGPADEFLKDLAKGDFQKAAQEMKSLQEKLAKDKLSEQEKKALKDQLQEMKEQLQKQANMEDRRKQLEEAKKNGTLSEKQYQEEMEKLDRQASNMKQLQKLADQLAKAQQAMEKGDSQEASRAMEQTQQQLSEMAKQMSEMESLDSALADLQDAKNSLSQDSMNQLGSQLSEMQFGEGRGDGDGQNSGLGRGRGQGDRPEAPDNTASYNTRVKQQYTKGKAVMEGFAPPSAQTKGEVLTDLQAEIESNAPRLNADAMTNQKVPAKIEKHVRSYFDQLKGGR